MGLKEKLLEAAKQVAEAEAFLATARAEYDNLYAQAIKGRNNKKPAPPTASGANAPRVAPQPTQDAPEEARVRDRILEYMAAARPLSLLSHTTIASAIGAKPNTVRYGLNLLRKEGRVEKPGRGKWRLKRAPDQKEIPMIG